MKRSEFFRQADKLANVALSMSNKNLGDAKQLLHMAISLVHADESERRDQEKARAKQ